MGNLFNDLHDCRSKCDANRDIVQASMGDPGSEEVYNEFHGIVRDLQRNLSGRGLLLDVHGMVSPKYAVIDCTFNELNLELNAETP